MSLAGVLICPPRSTSCLFPALVMPFDGKKAIVLDDTESMKAVDFFGKLVVLWCHYLPFPYPFGSLSRRHDGAGNFGHHGIANRDGDGC